MKRIACTLTLMGILACGPGETGTTSTPEAAPGAETATSAEPPQAASPGAAPPSEAAAPVAETPHPSVQGCLDLVREGRLAEAVAPCTEAVRNAPDNAEVAAALEQAKAAGSEKAAAAAQAAAGEAAGMPDTPAVPDVPKMP